MAYARFSPPPYAGSEPDVGLHVSPEKDKVSRQPVDGVINLYNIPLCNIFE